MMKANRSNVTPITPTITIDPTKAATVDELNTMWADAVATGQSTILKDAFSKRKTELS